VLSTPTQSARVIAQLLLEASHQTGGYYDERGQPMLGSALVRDTAFQDRVVAETRAFLRIPSELAHLQQSAAM
jgi:hypothetical protein